MGADQRTVVQVVAGVICRDGRYLVTKRKHDVHLGGFWEFPGGKLEAGESLEACLRRELWEELGIEIAAPELLHVTRHHYEERSVELHFFRCSIAAGEARSLDCDGIRWVLPEELGDLQFPPADLSFIKTLLVREGGG